MLLNKIKGIHLHGHKEMSLQTPIKEYLNPEFIYLPLAIGNSVYQKEVEIGDHVLKGQIILNRTDRFGHPISCPVSGTVKGVKKMWHASGKMVEMLEIENDFLETAIEGFGQPLEETITKELVIERVKRAGIVGLGGAGFPTYAKYNGPAVIETVLINAAECEPYITADYMLIKTQCEKLVRGITYIMKATGAERAYVAIKKSKVEAIEVLEKHLQDYPNINVHLLKDEYPAGWEKYIVEKVLGVSYNGLPSEVGAVVNNVQTAIAVCDAVEENKPLIEKVITITGEGLAQPQNYRVKIGCNVSSLIKQSGSVINGLGEYWVIAGGPMTGKAIMNENLVVSASLGSVIIKPKQIHENNPYCMGCGRCASNCPAHLTPTEIIQAHEVDDVNGLKVLNVTKCVQCGLCSYVCPSRIEVTEKVGKAKDWYLKMMRK